MPTEPQLKSTLTKMQLQQGAQLTSLGDWSLIDHFGDPDAEVDAVTRAAGAIDLSHLGRIRVRGDGALPLLERACTADVARQEDDTAILTCLCDAAGKIIDIAYLVRLEGMWVLSTNCLACPAVLAHLMSLNEAEGFDAKIDDQTFKTVLISVAGPAARELLDELLPGEKPSSLARGEARMGTMMVARYIAMRTGSTGQWSLEVMVPNMLAGAAWNFITVKAGHGQKALPPIGQAAWNTLRQNAGIPAGDALTGQTPREANLTHLLDLDDKDHHYLGREALE
jgi:aminomethyltransferase